MKPRYVARLRPRTYGDHDPIDFTELMFGGVGVWDTVRKCFVKLNERREWVPEDDA